MGFSYATSEHQIWGEKLPSPHPAAFFAFTLYECGSHRCSPSSAVSVHTRLMQEDPQPLFRLPLDTTLDKKLVFCTRSAPYTPMSINC